VLIVICDHFNLFGFTLASVGVDIFFVLSGFLITTLLLVEIERTGRLSFRNFYIRRALRLTPALLACVAFFGVVDLVLWVNNRETVLWSMGASALFYVSNWIRALDLWNMLEFGHTWSLAIEEQFYLIWPIALVALLWIFRGSYIAIAIALAIVIASVATFRASSLLNGSPREWVSSGFHFRVDAIFAGAAAALLIARFRPRPSRLAAAGAALGVAAICAVLIMHRTYLLWQQPIVVIATCAILVHLRINSASALHRALSVKWLVYTGVISYGLYLYHYPLVYLTVYRFGGDLSVDVKRAIGFFVLFPLSYAIAIVSYRFLEAPALRLKRRFYTAPTVVRGMAPAVELGAAEARPLEQVAPSAIIESPLGSARAS
jgi:peptidoglycan/LPS O-acetylase OafA/YrhL